ncbi:hypothetical protein B0J14DRAFT_53346 [Halenospora varia]|nr:hypothetical protein B0J14DRAFT_53346 [Halenospora varia]
MPNMPTQRPFFANFLAAFRAQHAIQQGKAASPSSSSATASSHTQAQSHASPSQPRTITTSSKGGATTSALTTLHSPRTHSASPLSRSPGPSTSTSPGPEQGRYMTTKTTRRGSDSSSEGFRDVLGKEKWYIGAKTPDGQERYFKLGVVRRQRSGDRLSLDRLSL